VPVVEDDRRNDGQGTAPPDVVVAEDATGARQAAAERFVKAAAEAVERRGRFDVALAGGRTPAGAYDLLRTAPLVSRVAWRRVHVWFGDERCVAPDDPDSNYGMAKEHLLDGVDIPRQQVHRFLGERDPDDAARLYAEELDREFPARGDKPRYAFDLVLLGMGGEGHTASLFPGSPALSATTPTAAPWVEKLASRRLTLTPRALNDARLVAFLVTGGGKASAVREALHGDQPPEELPVRAIRPSAGRVLWLLDPQAAAGLASA
jgi:6-phosphogluconolactonase